MAATTEAPEPWYLALLGFAEHFRTSSPPKIRLCVHCLQAVFQFKPPPRVEARTHLQLGSVLYRHTKNSELAQTQLEKAVSSSLGVVENNFRHSCDAVHYLMCLCDADSNVLLYFLSAVVHISTSILSQHCTRLCVTA